MPEDASRLRQVGLSTSDRLSWVAAGLAEASSVPTMERFGPLAGLVGDREGEACNHTDRNALTQMSTDELRAG